MKQWQANLIIDMLHVASEFILQVICEFKMESLGILFILTLVKLQASLPVLANKHIPLFIVWLKPRIIVVRVYNYKMM